MKSLKIILSAILLLCLIIPAHTQTVSFSYDNAGNRISRTIEEGGGLKSLNRPDTIVIEDEIKKDFPETETKLFPNPTSGLITIEFYPNDEEKYYVSINSISGYLLINQEIFNGENLIDISKYPPGTYLITIYSKEDRKQWNILKI